VPRWYDDASALIADPEVDAVYIATPPGSHAEYAAMVARAGKPVYVEKPMARGHAECGRMIDACAEAGVPLFVAYYRRMLPRFLKVKELLADGAIGDVRFMTIRLFYAPERGDRCADELPWRVQPELSGGGRFLDLGSHTLDLFDHLLGPIAEVRGTATNQAGLYPAEDTVAAAFTYASGALGTGMWCFASGNAGQVDENEIVGSAGRIRFSSFQEEPIELYRGDTMEMFTIPHPAHIQQPLIQTIVDELNGTGTCPSTGESAARTSWVMDECLRGYRERTGMPGWA
jgi:predicted dehydrogenase